MLNRRELRQLLSKRIKCIVTVSSAAHPHDMLFLMFDDDTYYEFFGEDIEATAQLREGGVEAILRSTRDLDGQVTQFVEGEEGSS